MFSRDQLESLVMPICALDLGVRAENGLRGDNINYMAQLLTASKAQLSRIPNFGKKSFNEIEEAVALKGFKMGSLRQYSQELQIGYVSPSHLKEVLLGLNIFEGEPEPDAFGAWALESLPNNLKQGLSPEFLNAVLDDPAVRKAVGNVLKDAVRERLGLNDGPA